MKVETENKAVVAAVVFFALGAAGGALLYFQPIVKTGQDWSATGTILSGIGGLLAGLAAVALAMIGRIGLSTWREQEIGKKRYALACEVLAKAYELEARYRGVIGNFVSVHEINAVPRLPNETQRDYDRRAQFDAIALRLDKLEDKELEFRVLTFQVKAVVGADAEKALRSLPYIRQLISLAVSNCVMRARARDYWNDQLLAGKFVSVEFIRAQNALSDAQSFLYGPGTSTSKTVSGHLSEAIANCEASMRSELERFSRPG